MKMKLNQYGLNSNEIWMISSLSDISTVGADENSMTTNCRDRLSFALENIEFKDKLEQDYLLTLTILNSSGQGLYLLMPKSLKPELMATPCRNVKMGSMELELRPRCGDQ
jgi:hypothetical protein